MWPFLTTRLIGIHLYLLCRPQPFDMATKPNSGLLTDLAQCNIFPWKIMMILCTANAIREDNFFQNITQTERLKAASTSAHNFRKTLYGLTVIDVSVIQFNVYLSQANEEM